jgi:hypothetical protein
MNYAGPVWLACLFFALVDWCVSGRKRLTLADEVAARAEGDSSTREK